MQVLHALLLSQMQGGHDSRPAAEMALLDYSSPLELNLPPFPST
jgi:hypothetical protein